ncbi:MAG: 3-methyl-2-oxobutanoate hydroxymethyltransferase, partial [Desulfosalsimonas sp.]
CAVVLEGIPGDISKEITDSLTIPTIGIGAGVTCDGQILVMHDMLGISAGHIPKFVKKYAELRQNATDGLKTYIDEVRNGKFPDDSHSY